MAEVDEKKFAHAENSAIAANRFRTAFNEAAACVAEDSAAAVCCYEHLVKQLPIAWGCVLTRLGKA